MHTPLNLHVALLGFAKTEMSHCLVPAGIARADGDVVAAEQVFWLAQGSGRVDPHHGSDFHRVEVLFFPVDTDDQPVSRVGHVAEQVVREMLEPTGQEDVDPAIAIEVGRRR